MFKYVFIVAASVWLTACKGPPVQEMSDARQAIAAARAAGAAEHSPGDLNAAQAAIARAESDLQQQHYARARMAAEEAKRRAAAALSSSHTAATATPVSSH